MHHFGGRLGDGMNYALLGATFLLPTLFSTRTGRTARQIAVPCNPRVPMQRYPSGGLVDTLPFNGTSGANNSKTVRDREKVIIDH